MTDSIYHGLTELLRADGYQLDAAEAQGALCGLLCGNASLTDGAWAGLLNEINGDPVAPQAGTQAALGALSETLDRQLRDPQFRFQLILPGDDATLSARSTALSRWSDGFLAGLAFAGVSKDQTLTPDVAEFIDDLAKISRTAWEVGDSDPALAEEEETAFFEIVEYARVGAMLVFETLVQGPAQASATEQQSIH